MHHSFQTKRAAYKWFTDSKKAQQYKILVTLHPRLTTKIIYQRTGTGKTTTAQYFTAALSHTVNTESVKWTSESQVSLYRFQIRPWRTFQKKKCIKSLLTLQLILTAWYFSEEKKEKLFRFLTTPPCNISCRYYLFENSKPMSWHLSQIRQSPQSLRHFFPLIILAGFPADSTVKWKLLKCKRRPVKTDDRDWHTKDSQGKK